MRQVTQEERDRQEHLPDCAGYEDCTCFGEYVTYREMWHLQKERSDLENELERLRQRIAKLRGHIQKACAGGMMAATPESGDYATLYDMKDI